jgi:putative transcriptional regulator
MTIAQMSEQGLDSIDALLARYVAGSLPAPAQLLVSSHLELKPESRRFVDGLEDLAGESLEAETGTPLSDRSARLASIFGAPPPRAPVAAPRAPTIFPEPLRRFAGFDADNVPWRTKMPGFREFDFGEIDGCHMSLFWIRPGRPIPDHTHEGFELTLVLDGAFRDIHGRYGRGDISIADETIDHRPIAEKDRPCISLAVTDAPLKLTGSFGRRLGDILFG